LDQIQGGLVVPVHETLLENTLGVGVDDLHPVVPEPLDGLDRGDALGGQAPQPGAGLEVFEPHHRAES